MRTPLIAAAAAALIVCLPAASSTTQPSLTATVADGQSAVLTGVYPGEARKKIGRQQMYQPQFGVYCYQNSLLVWAAFTGPGPEQNLGGGWWQATVNVTLGGTYNAYAWTAGAASCSALLGYFTRNQDSSLTYHQLASTTFTASPTSGG